MHPYMASAIADTKQRDLIHAAEEWRRAAEARTAARTAKDGMPRVRTEKSHGAPSLLRRLRTWHQHPAYR